MTDTDTRKVCVRTAQVDALALAIHTISVKSIWRDQAGLIAQIQERRADSTDLLIAKERIPECLPTVQFLDASAQFCRAWSEVERLPDKQVDLIRWAERIETARDMYVEGGVVYFPTSFYAGWVD
jgi:hypothetical protein